MKKREKDRVRRVPEMDGPMRVAVYWERMKPMVRAQVQEKWLAVWMKRMKRAIAEIAAVKSSQQFGREEEKKS